MKEHLLDISPVPEKRYALIKWPSIDRRTLTVTLYDAGGHFIFFRHYPLIKGGNELVLTNLETLQAGDYFIAASDGSTYRNGKLSIQ